MSEQTDDLLKEVNAKVAARERHDLDIVVAGLLIAIGLVIVIVKAIIEADWLLWLAIVLLVAGSWFASIASRRKQNAPESPNHDPRP